MKCFFIFLLLIFSFTVYSTNYHIHYLKAGETLWRVSKNYNISLDTLCSINNITNVTAVREGTKLKIPINNDSSVNYKIHYLKKDETLWRVSKNYNISLDTLCKINNIKNVKSVKVGASIKIPANSLAYKSSSRIYLDYNIPLNGSIKPFVTSHFRGLLIFTNNNQEKVYAIDDGVVNYVDKITGYGIVIYIKHANGYMSTYSGFKEIYVKHGEKVNKNQTIGVVGKLSRYQKSGILFSLIYKKKGIKFDMESRKFFIN